MADFLKELKKFVEYMGSAVLTGTHERTSDVLAEYNAKQTAVLTITDTVTGSTFVLTQGGTVVDAEVNGTYIITDLPYVLTASQASYVTQVIDVVPTRAQMVADAVALTVTLVLA